MIPVVGRCGCWEDVFLTVCRLPPSNRSIIIMSMCKHNIIANSTYSWWAAWLNNNKEKIVIVPPVWSKAVPDTSEIVPTNWKIINY